MQRNQGAQQTQQTQVKQEVVNTAKVQHIGKDLFSLTDTRYETLEKETNRLASLMETLVESSRVMDSSTTSVNNKYVNKTQNEKDELQLSTTASSMVDACQNLLRLISDVESTFLFHDYQRIEEAQNSTFKQEMQNNNN